LGVTKKENKMSEGSNKIQELVLDGDEGQVTFTLDDHGLVVEVFQQNFLSETIRRGDVHKLIAWLVINVLTPNTNIEMAAFRIIERMVDRLGYGRTENNPSLVPNRLL
jgi:hypothetical protein